MVTISYLVFKKKLEIVNGQMTDNELPVQRPIAVGYLSHSGDLINYIHACTL